MRPKRLFLAVDFPKAITDQLVELDPELPGVRWLRGDQMHLTLSFLGDVESATEHRLCEKLSAIRFKKFFLPVAGVGSFPGKSKPRVLWAGTGGGHPQLFHVHQRVQEAALAAVLEPELRTWYPHITLARCRDVSAESVRPFLKENAGLDAGLVRIESFSLYSSWPRAGGSFYEKKLEVRAL